MVGGEMTESPPHLHVNSQGLQLSEFVGILGYYFMSY